MRQNVHKPQRVIVRISSMDFVPSIINSLFTAFNIGIICVEQHDFATKISFYCHCCYSITDRPLVDTNI